MKTLDKKSILEAMKGWAEQYDILAPTRTIQGESLFAAFNENTFTLDYGKPPLPPKAAFFPQAEVIFQVENNDYREVVSAKMRLLFGIRSCDMTGILQASSFMLRDKNDMYYQVKKEAAVTVVMACAGRQNETCFCTTTQSGPAAREGFDLQLYDIGDDFLIEIGSPRGEALLSGVPLGDMEEGRAKQAIDAFRKKAAADIPDVPAVQDAMAKLKRQKTDEKVWEDLGKKCIACGGCAFVCPTCTCFNVHDQAVSPGNGLRLRAWDACLYGGFTREASGHNPRGGQAARLKRRHEHKLLDFNATDVAGSLCGCVGCGRCSDYCPVHIGTLEVVRAIAEYNP